MDVAGLNFHHLRYFWSVAKDGNLTRTARALRVSQSALSAQIRSLESQLGEALFTREGRRLELTEAGRIALAYAEEIFAAGTELLSTLEHGRGEGHTLRLGAVATLSRNFLRSFVEPALRGDPVRLRLEAGGLDELLLRLERHALDLVLSNHAAPRAPERRFRCRRLARQPASVVCSRRVPRFRFPEGLASRPWVLPSAESELRAEFDALCERHGVRVRVLAEVDDRATLRLLARDTDAFALVPSVVVREELRQRVLFELCVVPEVAESFYAIMVDRTYQHPLLRTLLARDEAALLAMEG